MEFNVSRLVEVLRFSQQFFRQVVTFFWIEPVKSNANKVSCSRAQHHAACEIRSRDLAVYGTLPSDLTVRSLVLPIGG